MGAADEDVKSILELLKSELNAVLRQTFFSPQKYLFCLIFSILSLLEVDLPPGKCRAVNSFRKNPTENALQFGKKRVY